MASVLRFVTPKIGRWYSGGTTVVDLIDFPFDTTATAVTVEVYPLTNATAITNATLTINGAARNFTSNSGTNPMTLTFNLGNDPAENAGQITNQVQIVALDNGTHGATTFTINYFRKAAATTTTTTTTTTAMALPVRKRAKAP